MEATLQYFWLEKTLLPKEMGYGLFSTAHLLSCGILLLFILLLYKGFRALQEGPQRRILQGIAVFMPLLEAFKLGLLLYEGVFAGDYVPLYLCSMGMYLFPIVAFSRHPRRASYAGTVSLLFVLPGAVMALLFPNWIGYYPAISFMSLYSYIWHGLLILFPLCAFGMGLIILQKSSIPKAYLFLVAMLPIILTGDRLLGQNFWFLERPDVNNPFLGIYKALGYPLYLACVLTLALPASLVIWAVSYRIQNRRSKTA